MPKPWHFTHAFVILIFQDYGEQYFESSHMVASAFLPLQVSRLIEWRAYAWWPRTSRLTASWNSSANSDVRAKGGQAGRNAVPHTGVIPALQDTCGISQCQECRQEQLTLFSSFNDVLPGRKEQTTLGIFLLKSNPRLLLTWSDTNFMYRLSLTVADLSSWKVCVCWGDRKLRTTLTMLRCFG